MFIQTEDPKSSYNKIFLGKEVMKSGTADTEKELSENSPLASRLFEIDGVDGVFLEVTLYVLQKKKMKNGFVKTVILVK